jgi:methylmalonyl-CoA mutase cobalamin-binding subunit
MKTVVAAAIGECVHVAGVTKFLRLAEIAGWRAVFLGPAVPPEKVLQAAREEGAELVGISYRLTPENGERLLGEFAEEADSLRAEGVRFAFASTPPVAARAEKMGFFERVFKGGEPAEEVLAYLKCGNGKKPSEVDFPQTAVERIHWKAPFPLIRHHFGLPDLEATRNGITKIATSGVLDVISLGIDQDAQENFFNPELQDPRRYGAGGVPVRSPEDYRSLYEASRTGNYPLLRTYSGTNDFLRLAEMYVKTIHIAWAAIPLFWFNEMDGRGPWDLEGSILEHQKVMRWYGERDIPVELNEPHHWGMRDAPDVVFVASAYLSAYNARAFGVKDYIAQFMFNSPPDHSDAMDLAKMLAILELIEPLSGPDFRIYRQTRTGLLSYPLDPAAARAHLSASVYLLMALRPHIMHVVAHTEADHAATADDIIEACTMARRAIENALSGQPDMTADQRIQDRKNELVGEVKALLGEIETQAHPGIEDPLTDPGTLTQAVTSGILDAPQLKNNNYAQGRIATRIDERGACVVAEPLIESSIEVKGDEMEKKTRYTVIGAGHGGKAMAAHLSLMGFPVKLYNRTEENISVIKARDGIELIGEEDVPRGFGQLELATSDLQEALEGADVIMVVLPSTAHAEIAQAAAAYLRPGQIVVLNPGRTLGALEFARMLNLRGCSPGVIVSEAETLIYASRSEGPAKARIFRIKESVPLAALPARHTPHVLSVLHGAYPQFIDGKSILHTGMNNMGAIFHPALTLLNAGRIESTLGDFQFYIDGVTPAVARVLEVLDRERVTVASALGIRARTAQEWLKMAYDARGEDLHDAIHNQPGYYGIGAPSTLNHRYISEDVPMSLVPIAALGQQFGVRVRGMDSIIRLACIIHRTDYWRRGRTLEKLGIASWSVSELTRYAMESVEEETVQPFNLFPVSI